MLPMRRAIVGCLACLFLAAPTQADVITLDFNEEFPVFPDPNHEMWFAEDYRHGYTDYQLGGVALGPFITIMQSDFANHDHEANYASVAGRATNPLVAVNGSGIMSAGGEAGHFEVTATDNRLFSVHSLDLLMGIDGGELGATQVTFEGYRGEALVGTLVIPLNWNVLWQLPSDQANGWTFADLRSLGWVDRIVATGLPTISHPLVPPAHAGNSAEFWVDNIRVHRVPEPSSGLLAALGAIIALGLRRRKT